MTATATVVAERHQGVLAVPNAALRFTPPEPKQFGPPKPQVNPLLAAGKARVWRLVNGQPEPTVVKRGVSDGRWARAGLRGTDSSQPDRDRGRGHDLFPRRAPSGREESPHHHEFPAGREPLLGF